MDPFLANTEIIDYTHDDVLALARHLGGDEGSHTVAERCFRWVRDQVRHSLDHGDRVVTLTASEVLRHRTGLCYAKSHLLAALLRANGIRTGFGYQRLSVNEVGPPFCLHGFNTSALPGVGWYRVDARGDRPGVATAFDPPREVLAYEPRLPGERAFDEVWPEPLPAVIAALRNARTVSELRFQLPDHQPV
jgi:transglutaminase-like putative cysteine protease